MFGFYRVSLYRPPPASHEKSLQYNTYDSLFPTDELNLFISRLYFRWGKQTSPAGRRSRPHAKLDSPLRRSCKLKKICGTWLPAATAKFLRMSTSLRASGSLQANRRFGTSGQGFSLLSLMSNCLMIRSLEERKAHNRHRTSTSHNPHVFFLEGGASLLFESNFCCSVSRAEINKLSIQYSPVPPPTQKTRIKHEETETEETETAS